MLVQDWGLDDTDLESLFSAREGAVSPTESLETSALRRLLDEYVKVMTSLREYRWPTKILCMNGVRKDTYKRTSFGFKISK